MPSSPVRALHFVIATSLLVVVGRAQQPAPYSQAEAMVRQGQFDQGIAILNQLLKDEPSNLKAHNLLGLAFIGKGDARMADQQFQQALDIDPNFVPVLKNLGLNEFRQKRLSEAEKHLDAAVKLSPDDPVIHAYLGKIAFEHKAYGKAAAHLAKSGELLNQPTMRVALVESYLEVGQASRAREQLRKIDPHGLDPKALFHLGLALSRHELYDEAIPFFRAVSLKYPDSYDASFDLGLCYVETKQYKDAIQVLQAAADRGRKTAELDNLLAEAYENDKQSQKAIDTLREATQLAPGDENNYVDLVALCTNYEAYDIAMEVIEVGLHYHPRSDRLIFQRGVIHAMRSEFDDAERDFQLASELAPEKNLSYVGLGISYMQEGNLPQAIHSLEARIKEKPNDATLQYLLGEALTRSGIRPGDSGFSEAKTALEKSVMLNAKFAPAQVDLARLYIKENRLEDALHHLEEAKTADPKDRGAYSQLAIVYRRQGKPELAAAMLTTLTQLNEAERKGDHTRHLRIVQDGASDSGKSNP